MNLNDIKKIYFIGIGGIGMSALARYFFRRGCEVIGYDKTKTTLTRKLAKEGMIIHYDESTDLIPHDVDLAIWTPAVPRSHPAFEWLQSRGIPLKKRAEVLGMLSRNMRCIAVAGTHGKTTTSSLITFLLHAGGVEVTAFLGGISKNFSSNYVSGNSEWMVVEADEYDRSFLQLSPEFAILLNMDPDHLDIYGHAEAVAETGFKEFVKKTKTNGKVFINHKIAQEFDIQLFETFGIGKGDYRAENVRIEDGQYVFDFTAPAVSRNWEANPSLRDGSGRSSEERHWLSLRLPMPGRHNVENAVIAIAVAMHLGVDIVDIRKGLLMFKGIHRRFEYVYKGRNNIFIDDYAHHPTEIRATIEAVRELYPGRKITGIFQPHLYSRTRDFQLGFAEELDKLDEIILLDIYPAREQPIPGITSEIIFNQMKNPQKIWTSADKVLGLLKKRNPDILLTLGAGDIDNIIPPILKWLKKKNGDKSDN